jgi:hypothetical protein
MTEKQKEKKRKEEIKKKDFEKEINQILVIILLGFLILYQKFINI